jgi:hypothetical protein
VSAYLWASHGREIVTPKRNSEIVTLEAQQVYHRHHERASCDRQAAPHIQTIIHQHHVIMIFYSFTWS